MDQPFLLADLWFIHDVRSAKLDQLFHIVLVQLSRSAQLSRLNIPMFAEFRGHRSQCNPHVSVIAISKKPVGTNDIRFNRLY